MLELVLPITDDEIRQETNIYRREELKELQIQARAAKLLRQSGDTAWRNGDTKAAFHAYEAAGLSPSELVEKAERLQKAQELRDLWAQWFRGFHTIAECKQDSVYYCTKPCTSCEEKKKINTNFVIQIAELLGWLAPKNFCRFPKSPIIDSRAGEFLNRGPARNPHLQNTFYQDASFAALKLAARITRIFLREEDEIAP